MQTSDHHSHHDHSNHHHHHEEHVFINGRPRTVTGHRLTYADVVKLAFPNEPFDPTAIFTVSYAEPNGHDGTLAEGQSVEVHNGMSFNVGKAGRS